MTENQIIAVRGYTIPKDGFVPENGDFKPKKVFFDRVLVWGCKAQTGLYQNLKFGYFKIYQHGILDYQGLFYDEVTVKSKDLAVLKNYSKKHNIKLYTVSEFRRIFLIEVYDLKTLCVGFDLPFAITRIAINASIGRAAHKDGFSLLLSSNLHYPRLHIAHASNTFSFVSWGNPKNYCKRFYGNFLDLRTLTFALTDTKHTLQSACEAFDTGYKNKIKNHAKITEDYIKSCIDDVDSTYLLYQNVTKEFETYNLDIPITRAFTPASIGKEILRKIGVKSFLQKNPKFSKKIIGNTISCYSGGRVECKIRKTPVKGDHLDFLAMYPTVCILQNLWRYVIAKRIDYHDATDEIKEFVDNFTIQDVRDKEIWKKFPAIVLLEPDEDILPIRAKFGKKFEWNIGVNYVTSETALWYGLADALSAKILSGKSPKIIKAIRFVPVGVQTGLKEIEIQGIKINPYQDDLFKKLVEYRQTLKDKRDSFCKSDLQYSYYDRLQNIIKIITNAISYGIFLEIATSDSSKKIPIDVYGLEHFTANKTRTEKPRYMFNPVIAVAITSASRLLLAAAEALLAKHDSIHAYCDTDSMFIPSEYTKEIQTFFAPLNPYDFDADILEIEKSNVWFYGISDKRYCLYEIKDDMIQLTDKYSAHGWGHLLSPFYDDSENWYCEIWQDILDLHYGKIDFGALVSKYLNKYALSKLAVTSPVTYRQLQSFNDGKDYYHKIKPANFSILGFSDVKNEKTGEMIKPFAPFCNPARNVVYDYFVDYHDAKGDKLRGKEFWKEFWDVFCEYLNHTETKLDGSIGILKRKHVRVSGIVHVGKESYNLEEAESFGLDSESYVEYKNFNDIDEKFEVMKNHVLKLKSKDVKKSVSKQTLWTIKNKIRENQLDRITIGIKIRLLQLIAVDNFCR